MGAIGISKALCVAAGLTLLVTGCGKQGGETTPPPTTTYVLTVNSVSPTSGVAIQVNPADVSGAGSGSTSFVRTYNSGVAVTLTAPATSGIDNFVSWSGCTSSSGATCTVTMTGSTTVTANYAVPATYTVTVNSTNPGSGVAIGAAPADNNGKSGGTTTFVLSYYAGASVTLTAPATSGINNFISWSGCLSSSGMTCTVAVNANATVTANYAAPAAYALTVNSTNPSSGVAIAAAPADNNGKISGTTSLALSYYTGTSVTLTAPASASGNAFASWSGCAGSSGVTCTVAMNANATVTASYAAPAVYTLSVQSATPNSGVGISALPADVHNTISGTTAFALSYNAGATVVLSAPATAGGYSFASWSGCGSSATATCTVTMNGNTTVTAGYNQPGIQSVSVTPTPGAITIGATQQFAATVAGSGSYSSAVTWSVAGPAGSNVSPGTISATGLYTTPYPAPASVTVTAKSVQDPTKSGSITVKLAAPTTASGPALSVNTGTPTHAISPYIYGMNNYQLSAAVVKAANVPVDRFGGDATSRYNYLLDVTSSASDYYFENQVGASGNQASSQFNGQVTSDAALGAKTIGTVNVLGWVAKDGTSCSFPVSKYPNQYQVDIYRPCGDGELQNQTNITGNAATDTSTAVGPSFAGNWVSYLVSKFGTAASGGVAIYDLDNEPTWWDAVHRDVHPLPSTYDEVTNNGLATAQAIKTADPTAEVSGPVVDYWWNYFYSKKDIESGWSSGPCYQPWSNPVDRKAHGGVPFIEYYLQQFAAYQTAHGTRLLDYLDVHAYFAATYNGSGVGLTNTGDTGEQQARLNSTRVFWDPTYTDPNNPQPNYTSDSNFTSSCSTPLQGLQVIPMLQGWVAKDYPGTKTAITEYNFGGQESINGAVAQADVLGIFGSYGLDLATLWGPPSPTTQMPGLMAFEIYRNYDGNNSMFGNQSLASTSADQGKLSVYGAQRTSDGAKTVVVINKTYGDLTSTLSLANFTAAAGETAEVFLYSNVNLNGIVAQSAAALTPPASGGTSSTLTATFPAQSITLFVVP
jgi:Glycoside hydrolase family 44/Bacterial Ig-like domain (group 2)